ncbi:MAG: GntR family transcriptional regulator [Atopobiaceae bacterium]|jgi:GntR family transcriptional regulator|nr:GntR family transcriptional regulator [Atopobiaceae bacterium]
MMKYKEVVKGLQEGIERGDFKATGQLPTIAALCKDYGVSKITIKKAMDDLEQMGLISRRRGSGTFVKNGAAKPVARSGLEMSQQMSGFNAEHSARGEKVESVVYDFSVTTPPEKVARLLGMEPDEFAYHICRVRLADEVAYAIEYTYMPIKVIPDLRLKHVEASIYAYVEDELGLKIASAHRTVRASLPTAEECERLGVGQHEPLLEVEQIGYLDDGIPFEFSVSRHPHGYEFFTISTR